MKKLSKVLATSLALALTLGFTVSAEEGSPSGDTSNTDVTQEVVNAWADIDAGSLEVTAATVEEYEATVAAVKEDSAKAEIADALGIDSDKVNDAKVLFEVNLDGVDGVTETLEVPQGIKLDSTKKYVLAHKKEDGVTVEEYIAAEYVDDTHFKATFKSFSNYALVEVEEKAAPGGNTGDNTGNNNGNNNDAPTPVAPQSVSPQTGETVPVAGFVALILLAGAAVCAKKAQFNN